MSQSPPARSDQPDSGRAAVRGRSVGPVRVLPWAALAGIALAAGGLLVRNTTLRQEQENMRTELRLAELASESARHQLAERTLLAERIITEFGQRLRQREDLARLKVSVLAAAGPEYQEADAVVVWDPETHAGLLVAENLPALAPTKSYRLWVLASPEHVPASAAAVEPDADGHAVVAFKAREPGPTAPRFAISVESKGDPARPEGPIAFRSE